MKRKYLLALCCLILIGAVSLLPKSAQRQMKSALGDLFMPFTSFVKGGYGFIARFSRDEDKLVAENRIMAVELERARYELLRLRALEEENRKLRELLGFAETSPHGLVAGRVIARQITGWWRKVRIDAGKRHGVEADMPVVDARGLVGRIVSASERTSDVLLLIDPSCRVSARAPGSDAFGIVRGRGVSARDAALCRMDFISRGARIKRGDEIVTSGLGGVYPPGIVIGYVQDVRLDESGLYRQADILAAADFGALDMVFVALP